MATSEATVLGERFLETRAAQLAAVLLTRHRDISVEIEPGGAGRGLDLLVSFLEQGQDTDFLLGIEVQAVRPRTRPRSTEQALRETNRLRHPLPPQVSFPVCLFVFTMDDDRGYWRWLLAPGEDAEGLVAPVDSALQPLTDDAVSGLLTAARAWYR